MLSFSLSPLRLAARLAPVACGCAVAAVLLGATFALPPRPASGVGEEAEIVLKDGTVLRGTILQELRNRIKIETESNEVRSIDVADIEEIRRAPNTDSRVVDILSGIDELLAGQREILDRLAKGDGAPPRAASRPDAPRGRESAPAGGAGLATPERLREALGDPEAVVKDCFSGSTAAGPNPFPSEKWTFSSGSGGLRAGERRSVYFVNGICVGSIVEVPGGALRPDDGLRSLLGE